MNNPIMENVNRRQPTGYLDSSHGEEAMELLAKLNEAGTTIIMVTHSPAYAEYRNRVVHLFDGHVVAENMKGKFHV
jgi:putative ABC transport system ATP-binding protein